MGVCLKTYSWPWVTIVSAERNFFSCHAHGQILSALCQAWLENQGRVSIFFAESAADTQACRGLGPRLGRVERSQVGRRAVWSAPGGSRSFLLLRTHSLCVIEKHQPEHISPARGYWQNRQIIGSVDIIDTVLAEKKTFFVVFSPLGICSSFHSYGTLNFSSLYRWVLSKSWTASVQPSTGSDISGGSRSRKTWNITCHALETAQSKFESERVAQCKEFQPTWSILSFFRRRPKLIAGQMEKTHFVLTTSCLILSLRCSGKVHPRVWAEHCDITVGCGYKRNNINTQKLSYRGHKRSKMCSCVLLTIVLLTCIRPPLLAVDCEEAMMAQACSHDAAHSQVSSGFLKEQIQTHAFDCQYKPVFFSSWIEADFCELLCFCSISMWMIEAIKVAPSLRGNSSLFNGLLRQKCVIKAIKKF